MARILVIGAEEGLAGIVARLFSEPHAVTEVTDERAAVSLLARGARFEAIVCDVPRGEAPHDDLWWDHVEQARRLIFLAPSPSPDGSVEPPYRCLPKPFSLEQLRRSGRSRARGRAAQEHGPIGCL